MHLSKPHNTRSALRRARAFSLPRQAVSLFAAFTLAFGLFPAGAFAQDGQSVVQLSLGSTESSASASQSQASGENLPAVASVASTAASAQTQFTPMTIGEDETIALGTMPLNLVQNGNYQGVEEAAVPSTNASITASQKAALKARLNTALSAVSYTSYAGQSNWCVLSVLDLKAPMANATSATSYVKSLVEEVINENPDLFYAGAQYGAGTSGGYMSKILVQYYYTPSTIGSMKTRYETAMQGVLKWVPASGSEAEKAKAVHDWLVRNVSYNTAAANKGGPTYYGSWNPWNGYGAVVDKKAVCEGYSLAFMAAMKRIGITATFVTNANHGWNRVRLYDTLPNGSSAGYYWFNLDVTWDDPLPDKGYNNTPNTTYFLKSDSYFKSHDTGSYGEHKKWTPAGTAGTNTKYDSGWSGGVYKGNASRGTVTALTLSPSSISMSPDSSQQLSLVVSNSQPVVAGEAKWTSSNPAVAAVSSTGLVTSGGTNGTATITVTLGGKTARCTVTVKSGVSLAGAAVTLSASTFTYKSGLSQRPTPTVKVNGKALTVNKDYKITYPSSSILPGTYTATITGLGNYTGTKTFTYKITGPITSASVSPASGKSYSYTGAAIKPTITVKFGSNTLKEGTDYTLTWPSNTTSVGTKTVTITGKGAYSGTRSFIYKIAAVSISTATVSYSASMRYTGKAVTQTPEVKLNGSVLASSNYTVTYKNNVNAGTATMTITGKGNYSNSVIKTFKIVKTPTWNRLAGSTALDTMRLITRQFGTATTAVVASNADFKDTLAAAGLAGSLGAPLLTTAKGSLSSETRGELNRMGVTTVYVVGTTSDVSAATYNQILALSKVKTVKRISGASASAKAINIAAAQPTRSNTVIIATQASFGDALSVSSYAYATASPILYVESNKTLSTASLNFIKGKFSQAIIVGGPLAIPASVVTQLQRAGISASKITRLAGQTRYETSRVIAEWGMGKLRNGLGGGSGLYRYASIKMQPNVTMGINYLGVSRGDLWKDALAGAALCGKYRSVILLMDTNGGDHTANTAVIKANKSRLSYAYIYGGTYAVSTATYNKCVAAAK